MSALGFIIYQFNDTSSCAAKHKDEHISRVCISMVQQEIPAPPLKEDAIKEKKVEEKVVKKELVKVHKKLKEEIIHTKEPLARAVAESKEVVKEEIVEPIKTQELVVEETTKEVSNTNADVKKSQNAAVAKAVDKDVLKSKQDLFLAHLVEKINANKTYPNNARRRGVEGNVEVKFNLYSDGSVNYIKLISGQSIFEKATFEAISKSFPVSVDSTLFDFPKELKITIAYVLK